MKNVILIIDNYSRLRKTVRALIEKNISGLAIKEANNGKTGIVKAVREKAEVVVLDIMLPDMHGLDVAKKIKEKIPKVGIVLLTMCARESICKCDTTGTTTAVKKSEIFEKLILAIRKYLRGGE